MSAHETAEPWVPIPPEPSTDVSCSECGGEEFDEVRPVPGIFNTVVYVCMNCGAEFTPDGTMIRERTDEREAL